MFSSEKAASMLAARGVDWMCLWSNAVNSTRNMPFASIGSAPRWLAMASPQACLIEIFFFFKVFNSATPKGIFFRI